MSTPDEPGEPVVASLLDLAKSIAKEREDDWQLLEMKRRVTRAEFRTVLAKHIELKVHASHAEKLQCRFCRDVARAYLRNS